MEQSGPNMWMLLTRGARQVQKKRVRADAVKDLGSVWSTVIPRAAVQPLCGRQRQQNFRSIT
jgi:hypothetical protein